MGLLDTTGRRSRFTSSLGGELLARGFATSALKEVSDDQEKRQSEQLALRAVCLVRAIVMGAWLVKA